MSLRISNLGSKYIYDYELVNVITITITITITIDENLSISNLSCNLLYS